MRGYLAYLTTVLFTLSACSDAGTSTDTGSISLGLRDSISGWFYVKIYEKAPTKENMSPNVVFETGCIDAKSQTYELNNIPAGDDFVVEISSFGSAECSEESQVEVGYRGRVDIPDGKTAPYYHVPLFEVGASTAFPEDINISASVAEPIDFCDSDDQCAEFSENHVCFDGQSPSYWCVPACSENADCGEFHPQATCDTATNWCVLRSPYPLNLASPRALGHATTLVDGSVAFVGGFGSKRESRMVAAEQAVEVFDVKTGLFEKRTLEGLDDWVAGMSGATKLPDGRMVVVGGVRTAQIGYADGPGGKLRLTFNDLAEKDCSSDPCLPNIRKEIVVMNLEEGTAVVSDLPIPLAAPTVLALGNGKVLVAGGYAPSFGGLGGDGGGGNEVTDRAWLVEVDPAGQISLSELGTMTVPRVGAAAMCQTNSCDNVLIVGGNQEGSVAEVMTASDDEVVFVPVSIEGLPPKLHNPILCESTLVAGSGAKPVQLVAEEGNWTAVALENSDFDLPQLPATATSASGDCWVVGGLTGSDVSGQTFWTTGEAVAPNTYEMKRARFGAMAAPIASGLLDGGLIFGGGLTLAPGDENTGDLVLVRGAEIILP